MTSPNRSANLTREETAARAAVIDLHEVRVRIDVREAPDPNRTGFPVTSEMILDAGAPETWIDFLGERVDRVRVNDDDVPVVWDGARIRIAGLREGRNAIVVDAVGRYSVSGEGLHRFVDPADGETYLYTQYEPADARRVTPCLEQPDAKARWMFEALVPAGWRALSNGEAVEIADETTHRRVRFAQTLPLPSYLTAFVAGPYHRVEGEWSRGSQSVRLGVLCRAALLEHLDAEEILEITRQGLDFFDETFGFPYPWGKYDQIFVPEYNLGAMENPGLVTFTESYVFRGASTRAQHEARANTILHEMAHMWFGDLVTMRWWDDLWLKESFADYMGAHASVAATAFSDAWVSFANRRKAWAYQADQLPTTHPIVADIPDLEAAKLNFDGITYAKGASVLKQLVAFVGEDAFFAGARRYFADHAFGSTTLADLLAALAAASSRDLDSWSDAWLRTTGMSTIGVDRSGDEVAVTQTDARPHRIAVGAYRLTGDSLMRAARVELDITAERTPLAQPLAGSLRSADLLLPNDGDLTYAKIRLDERSTETAEQALSGLGDDLARGLVWSALWNAVRDGELDPAQYLDVVRRHAPAERHVGLLAQALDDAAFAVAHFVADERRVDERRAWLETTWSGLRGAEPGGDAQLAWARALARAAGTCDVRSGDIRALLSGEGVPDGLPLDPDLRWALVTALAASGDAGAEEVDAELRRDDTLSGRTWWVRARASLADRAVRRAAWASAWEDETLSNDHLAATIAGATAGDSRALIGDLDDDYFSRIRDAWATRSIETARRLVRGLFPQGDDLGRVDAWLARKADAPGALRRLVLEQRDHLARDLRVRALW